MDTIAFVSCRVGRALARHFDRLSATPASGCGPQSSTCTRTPATTNLAYSATSSRAAAPLAHHGSSRHFSPITGNGISSDVGHGVRQLDDGARHVIVRGHDDQRAKAALLRPAPRFGGIAAGVDRRVVEIDAAGEQRFVVAAASARFRRHRSTSARRRSAAAGRSHWRAGRRRRTRATSRRSGPRCHPPACFGGASSDSVAARNQTNPPTIRRHDAQARAAGSARPAQRAARSCRCLVDRHLLVAASGSPF